MSARFRAVVVAVVVAAVCLVASVVCWRTFFSTPRPLEATSLARFATADFVAACRVRPRKLEAHPFFGTLPLETYTPARLTFRRLEEAGVEELVVFYGPSDHKAPNGDGVTWAAAARLSEDLELAEVLKRCRRLLPRQAETPQSLPKPVRIDGRDCLQLPAGSLLIPTRQFGSLRFVNRNGETVDRGVNVGELYTHRTYVEGATKAAAIVTLDGIDEAVVGDDGLALEFRPKVFRTHYIDSDFDEIEIVLQNPANGLRTKPIPFAVRSLMNHLLTVPRTLPIAAAEDETEADIVKDLADNGRVDFLLRPKAPAVYLGMNRAELNVRREAFEYVYFSGREIVVAQTRETLQTMLAASREPTALARRLSVNADLVVAAEVTEPSRRPAWRRFLRTIGGDHELVQMLADAGVELQANVSVSGPVTGELTAAFKSRAAAKLAEDKCQQAVTLASSGARESIRGSFGRLGAANHLASIGLGAVSLRFPQDEVESFDARVADMTSIIENCLNQIAMRRRGSRLTVKFTQPASLAQLDDTGRIALANLDEVLARDLFQRGKYDAADDRYQRVTDRFPDVPQTWYRRSHQLAYNTTAAFNDRESRYGWIRRGVDVLLDGGEQNPDSTDLHWMTAKVIGPKIGNADERADLRRRFDADAELHERLAKVIDLEGVQSPLMKVDNWLVAKRIFERCIERQGNRVSSTIPPLVFHSRPAATQARFSQSLNEAGLWNEAQTAWQEAERMHLELEKRTIALRDGGRVRLGDLPERLAELGGDHAVIEKLQTARDRIHFDYWLLRCRVEQTDEVRSARRIAHEAVEQAAAGRKEDALVRYRESLQQLMKLQQRFPEQMPLLAGEFKSLAKGYRAAAGQMEANDDALDALLTLIEQSPPQSRAILFDKATLRPIE